MKATTAVQTPAELRKRIERVRKHLSDAEELLGEVEAGVNGVVIHDLSQAVLLGTAEVAELLEVGGPLISTWTARGRMPEPVARLAAGPVWTKSQILPLLYFARKRTDEEEELSD